MGKEFSVIFPVWCKEFVTNIVESSGSEYMEIQCARNSNFISWLLDEISWFQPFVRFGLHFMAAPITNCISEANLKKLSSYNAPQRNRMLPETLTDLDQIHMKVLNEYKNSKLLEKYTFAPEFIAMIIEAAQLQNDVPYNYRKCLINIEETKDKLSLVCSKIYTIYYIYHTIYILYFLLLVNLKTKNTI